MTKNLKKLTKELGFTHKFEYYDYCSESYINGNFSQCESLFKSMTKEDRKGLLSHIMSTQGQSKIFTFYFNLL